MSKQAETNLAGRQTPVSDRAGLAAILSRPTVVGLLLLAVTLLAYLPLLHAGFIWDDDDYVTQNPALLNLTGLKNIWCDASATPQYYPLVFTTFWVEFHLWGLQPLGYHLVNVLLHALGAVLLWRVLERLQVPGAKLAAFIFALHPVCVESVAWVTERKNVLSGVFYFAAALAWLRFAQKSEVRSQKSESPTSGYYWLALFLFAGALLSKTVTASLPAALLLVCWWKRKLRWSDAFLLLPFFVLGAGLGLHTAWLERHHVGAQGQDWSLNFAGRCLIAGRALWFYAGKLAWPVNLTFIYPRWSINAGVWWQWLFPLTTGGVVLALWSLRRRWGKGPLVAVLFFAGTLFPALGFVDMYPMRFSFVADHFQYIAAAGLIALAAAGLVRVLSAKVVWILPLALGVLTWQQTHAYRDLETIWRDTLTKNPGCWLAHNNLGVVLKERGEMPAAETEYHAALKLKPDYAEALNNLGEVYFIEGKKEQAVRSYRDALQGHPNFTPAFNGLGDALLLQGHPDEALDCFRKALASNPDDPDTLNNLGSALAAKRQFADAVAAFEKALRLKPQHTQARINLGNALMEMGKTDTAVAQFQQALKYEPGSAKAHADLARALALQGRQPEAIQHYSQALRLGLKDAEASYNFATLLGAVGRVDESIQQFQMALQLRPDYAEAHNNLGVNLIVKGKLTEAIRHFNESLRLKPDYAEAHNNLAYALIQSGRLDEARQHLLEALRLQPDYAAARRQLDALNLKR